MRQESTSFEVIFSFNSKFKQDQVENHLCMNTACPQRLGWHGDCSQAAAGDDSSKQGAPVGSLSGVRSGLSRELLQVAVLVSVVGVGEWRALTGGWRPPADDVNSGGSSQ